MSAWRRMTAIALLVTTLTACSSTKPTAQDSSETGTGATIEHVYGVTPVPASIDSFAVVSWGTAEAALALGAVPTGMPEQTWGGEAGLYPWTREALDDLGAETPMLWDEQFGAVLPTEAIASVEPDVILAVNSGLTQEEYQRLTEIAPTVAYPEVAWGTPWREVITMTAAALGMPEEGDALVTDLEGRIEAATSERPQIAGLTTAFTFTSQEDLSTLGFNLPSDSRVDYLRQFGLVDAPSITMAASDSEETLSVSAELASEFADIDILVAYGDESLLEAMQADPMLNQIPAIARGSVVLLPNKSDAANAAEPNALAIAWGVEDYVAKIAAAADRIE